jgi:hypothetical protein
MRAGAGIDCEGPSRHRPALVPSIAARFRSGEWQQQPHGYQPRPAIEISKLTGVPPAEKFVTAHPEAATRFRIEQSRPLLVRQLTYLARSTFNATLRRAPFAVTGFGGAARSASHGDAPAPSEAPLPVHSTGVSTGRQSPRHFMPGTTLGWRAAARRLTTARATSALARTVDQFASLGTIRIFGRRTGRPAAESRRAAVAHSSTASVIVEMAGWRCESSVRRSTDMIPLAPTAA